MKDEFVEPNPHVRPRRMKERYRDVVRGDSSHILPEEPLGSQVQQGEEVPQVPEGPAEEDAQNEEEEDADNLPDLPSDDEDALMNDEAAMDDFMGQYFHEEMEEDPPPESQRPSRQRAWKQATEHAKTRIFTGARVSRLSAILMLLNLQARYQASNALLDDLLRILNTQILPTENTLPSTWQEAKKLLQSIGMAYELIHACPNDCVLFRGEYADLSHCPQCEESRYRTDMVTDKVPVKALRYFPLIPRLLHMYRCDDLAELQVWHSKHRSDDEVMRLPVDSPCHKFVERRWPAFAQDPRHVRLGLATDGISPHSMVGKGQPYTVWPVVLMNYNIPPWLSMKKGHLMLSMIVPGPKQTKNFDVYLAPLVEELQMLWEGVPCVDGRQTTGGLPRKFNLRAILMWTMHDYPGTPHFYKVEFFC